MTEGEPDNWPNTDLAIRGTKGLIKASAREVIDSQLLIFGGVVFGRLGESADYCSQRAFREVALVNE